MPILGPDGKPVTWAPDGFSEPKQAPTISLSAHLQQHASGEEEVERWKEEQRNRVRCPVCQCPYENATAMQKCASIPVNKEVSNWLGFDEGQIITFDLHNPKTGWRAQTRGFFLDWRVVRTPRGHEEMPLIGFHVKGVDGQFEAILVPDPKGVMTAYPHFTRKPGDPRGEL